MVKELSVSMSRTYENEAIFPYPERVYSDFRNLMPLL
jgi:hypothetical protein